MELDNSFPDLLPEEREALRDAADVVTYPSGAEVIVQGEKVKRLLVIRSGMVRVTQAYLDDLIAEFVGPLGPGDVVGEMSFIDGENASATLVADGDVEAFAISHEVLDGMSAADAAFTGRFYRSLFLDVARRLRKTNLRVVPQ